MPAGAAPTPEGNRLARLALGLVWLLMLATWLLWNGAEVRDRALVDARPLDAEARCPVLTTPKWRRGTRYAYCWPLGLAREHRASHVALGLALLGIPMGAAIRRARLARRGRAATHSTPTQTKS